MGNKLNGVRLCDILIGEYNGKYGFYIKTNKTDKLFWLLTGEIVSVTKDMLHPFTLDTPDNSKTESYELLDILRFGTTELPCFVYETIENSHMCVSVRQLSEDEYDSIKEVLVLYYDELVNYNNMYFEEYNSSPNYII